MTSYRPRHARLLAVVLALAVPLALAACGGSEEKREPASPTQALETAKRHFDEAVAIELDLSTKAKPTSGDAVLGATGTLTHQPAFEGSVKVVISGLTADVPVVSVDGKVHAKLPLSPVYSEIDPSEYGAPDPADFADPDQGISGLLLQMGDVERGDQMRDGDDVLTTYTGTLDGALVKPIIPSADAGGSYTAKVGIDEDGEMATLSVTGDFFAHDGQVTYDISFDYDDDAVTITAP